MRNIPPPGHKRVRDWLGKTVELRHDVQNNYYRIPAGTVMTVERVRPGDSGIHLIGVE